MIQTKFLYSATPIAGVYPLPRIGVAEGEKLRLIEIRAASGALGPVYVNVVWNNDEICRLPPMLYNPDYVFESMIQGSGTLAVDLVVPINSALTFAVLVMYEITK